MAKNSVGKLINKIREEKRITQKQLCEGLCSSQKLSLIESGLRMPDIFTFECLIQRLGLSPDDFETVLYDDEYQEIELRNRLEKKIVDKEFDTAIEMLEEYGYSSKEAGLKGQYWYQIMALVASMKKEHNYAIKLILQAFDSIHPDWKSVEKDSLLASTKDLELGCMLVDEYMAIGAIDSARELVKELSAYVENHLIQEVELAKVYPKLAYLTSRMIQDKKEQIEAITMCEKAFHLLVVNDSTVFLAEIMEILICNYRNMNLRSKVVHLERQLQSLEALYKEFGGCIYSIQGPMRWFEESFRKELFHCQEILNSPHIEAIVEVSKIVDEYAVYAVSSISETEILIEFESVVDYQVGDKIFVIGSLEIVDNDK